MIDTINTVCKDIAPKLGMSEQLVKKVYAHYWKTVKSSVSSGKHTSVWLRGLGTLAVSRLKVRKQIIKLINRIRALKEERSKSLFDARKTKEQMIVEALGDLRLMCERRNELAIIYKANLEQVNQRYVAKHKGRMGQQASDSTGSGEQVVQPL